MQQEGGKPPHINIYQVSLRLPRSCFSLASLLQAFPGLFGGGCVCPLWLKHRRNHAIQLRCTNGRWIYAGAGWIGFLKKEKPRMVGSQECIIFQPSQYNYSLPTWGMSPCSQSYWSNLLLWESYVSYGQKANFRQFLGESACHVWN